MKFIKKILKKLQSEKGKIVILFIKKSNNSDLCAVSKLYETINKYLNGYDVVCFDEATSQEVLSKHISDNKKVIIFAHFEPGSNNIHMFDDGENSIPWASVLAKNAGPSVYGHICFGSIFFRRERVQGWVSYGTYIKYVANIGWLEERTALLYKRIIDEVGIAEDHTTLQLKILSLYKEEIKHMLSSKRMGAEIQIGILGEAVRSLTTSTN